MNTFNCDGCQQDISKEDHACNATDCSKHTDGNSNFCNDCCKE